jgi:elongator complex protein 1
MAPVTPRVLLLERNGLHHGGFPLPYTGDVASLTWSADSEILAVIQLIGGTHASTAHQYGNNSNTSSDVASAGASKAACWVLQLWHRSNWHWYLKVERRYAAGGAGSAAPHVVFDDQAVGRVHVLVNPHCEQGGGQGGDVGVRCCYEQLDLVWENTVSDLGTAAVVDGATLQLTPLRFVCGVGVAGAWRTWRGGVVYGCMRAAKL